MSKPTVEAFLQLIKTNLEEAAGCLNANNLTETRRLLFTAIRYTEKALKTTQEETEQC